MLHCLTSPFDILVLPNKKLEKKHLRKLKIFRETSPLKKQECNKRSKQEDKKGEKKSRERKSEKEGNKRKIKSKKKWKKEGKKIEFGGIPSIRNRNFSAME